MAEKMQNGSLLRCAVVGAGIAGLAAAIALRRAGHQVDLYEKSSFKHEIGAAITMTPNANMILDRWNVDPKRTRATIKHQSRALDPGTLQEKANVNYDGVIGHYGYDVVSYHRVDLHEELRKLVDEARATIHPGRSVADLDCESGTLKLEDGTVLQSDLIIVADGINSRFVSKVVGAPVPFRQTGNSTYRTLIPADRLMADPLTRLLFEDHAPGMLGSMNPTTGTLCVLYPCRDNTLMNFAYFHRTKDHEKDKESWHSPATIEDAVEVLDGFHPAFAAVARHADSMNCYVVGCAQLLPRLNHGRAVVIGDAAHAMLPTHGQGGCMALEDAAALEVLFSNWQPQDDPSKRLKLFNQLRLPRITVTQLTSNTGMYGQDQDEVDDKIREFWKGPLLPRVFGPSQAVEKFFYGYDAFAEAEKAMVYKDHEDGLPDGVIEHFGDPFAA